MKDSIVLVIVGAIYIATITALVRPNSKGPQLVNNVLSSFSDLVRGSLGYSYDTSNKKWVPPSK
jgi:hypothetical protein